jgi:hypothetical protein
MEERWMPAENLGTARIVADIWRDTVKQKDKRIAELEAALHVIVDAWHMMPPGGLDPMVPAIENAESVLRKSEKS